MKGDAESTEIAVLPKRLELLALTGRIVTADTLHPQRAPAEAVPAKGGASALAGTGNPGRLPEDGPLSLDAPAEGGKLPSCEQVDGAHGHLAPRPELPREGTAARAP